MMKRGFTLVELMIAVTVIAILIALVTRFGNIGDESQRRTFTVSRMQRLENALSGYYAAFGTYPPVALHGSRDYTLKVSSHGIQNEDGEAGENLWNWLNSTGTGVRDTTADKKAEKTAWQQVEAACRSQPVGCYFPYSDDYAEQVESYSEALKSYAEQAEDGELTDEQKEVYAAGFDAGIPVGRFSSYKNESDWRKIQLFRFGLMSFLLPRYLFMMEGDQGLFDHAQWTANNELPCDPLTGKSYTGGWNGLRDDSIGTSVSDLARVANIPSQVACARWMANFEQSLTCSRDRSFFGVDVRDDDEWDVNVIDNGDVSSLLPVFSPGGFSENSHSGQYVLNMMTIRDGWHNDFYYYSPAPYQSYVVWSSGPNGRTFPPWVAREKLSSEAKACVGYWTADDIVSLRK